MLFIYLFILAYGILVPQPGLKPTPSTLEAWSRNHWTTREVPTGQIVNREAAHYSRKINEC